ncbi:MAG: SDR family NAD(P)-dependent oxidoreductase [Planctomycetes bacterium]|nr:SDR family NAD(P)-dependent oxidoreductase [Planctomycetota bacterium]
MGLLDGKVAIITGSGGGIGFEHAKALGKEGAKIVINDLGGTRDGEGAGTKMADEAVTKLKELGVTAVANYDNVALWDGAANLIKTGVDAFGRVDILVNNAGILRDKTLHKMEEPQWDAVIAVHLKGTFLCGKHFAARIREQGGGGAIVNTTSIAGLMGNFGQTNYSAAKAGIYGITMTWSQELRKDGIRANAVAPIAYTRMTNDLGSVPENWTPAHISPIIVFLASDLAEAVNGRIVGVHGSEVFEWKMGRSEGVTKPSDGIWTPAELKQNWEKLLVVEKKSGGGAEVSSAVLDAIKLLAETKDENLAKSILSGAPAGAGAKAAAPMTPKDKVNAVFPLIVESFRAEKAAGWNANIVFEIEGADAQTLSVSDSKCIHTVGKKGTPTCTVKLSADTILGMISGTVDPQQAFMKGQIKADNLSDMMKYGSVFKMDKSLQDKAKAIVEGKAGGAPAAGGGSAPMTPKDKVNAVFPLIVESFRAEKAAGWNANIVFEIEGADAQTLTVADGKVKHAASKQGTPTCTVKLSADTILGMISGTVDPQQAFMKGQIKADNLSDMMKYGSVFKMDAALQQKAKAIVEGTAGGGGATAGGGGGAAPQTPKDKVNAVFPLIVESFRAEKAAGWTANIVFEIEGADAQTLTVSDGKVKYAVGKQGTPTCTVKLSADTILGMISGTVDPQQAFMKGQIKADNLSDMMKYGSVFKMDKSLQDKAKAIVEGTAGGATAGGAAPAEAKKEPQDYIGRTYRSEATLINPDQIEAYARATNDLNPRYLDHANRRNLPAPPLLAIRFGFALLGQLVMDPDLGLDPAKLVHGEQEFIFHRPLRSFDLVNPRAEFTGYEEKNSGVLAEGSQFLWVDGELATTLKSGVFIRGAGRKAAEAKAKGEKSEKTVYASPAKDHKVLFTHNQTVDKDQTFRYAEASGDGNPIHVDENFAKAVGFKGIILHGMCTMAFCATAVVNNLCDAAPERLARIKVRMSATVYPGDKLTITGWKLEEKDGLLKIGFDAKNQEGVYVITGGEADVRN